MSLWNRACIQKERNGKRYWLPFHYTTQQMAFVHSPSLRTCQDVSRLGGKMQNAPRGGKKPRTDCTTIPGNESTETSAHTHSLTHLNEAAQKSHQTHAPPVLLPCIFCPAPERVCALLCVCVFVSVCPVCVFFGAVSSVCKFYRGPVHHIR